jgi:hypothetical protein
MLGLVGELSQTAAMTTPAEEQALLLTAGVSPAHRISQQSVLLSGDLAVHDLARRLILTVRAQRRASDVILSSEVG